MKTTTKPAISADVWNIIVFAFTCWALFAAVVVGFAL